MLDYCYLILWITGVSYTVLTLAYDNRKLTPQNLSIEICIKKIVSICIYVKIALTKKKKKKKILKI